MCSNIVWGKLKGHPVWPAKISSPPENLKNTKNTQNKKCLHFFGTFDL